MQQPRQTQAEHDAPSPQPLLPGAPAAWKAPTTKLIAAKAIAGSALPAVQAGGPAAKKIQDTSSTRWQVGYIYAFFGVFDICLRFTGQGLYRFRHSLRDGFPSVSDTQRFEVTDNVYVIDILMVAVVSAAAVLRCSVNLFVLWSAFAQLRPMWTDADASMSAASSRGRGLPLRLSMARSEKASREATKKQRVQRTMRWWCPLFKGLLVLWCLTDFLQACTPNIPPDPTEHRILTVHIMFHQIACISCGLANLILLYVICYDSDSRKAFVTMGCWTWLILAGSFIYYDVALFKGQTGKSNPTSWGLVIEFALLMFSVGLAMPPQIQAFSGMKLLRCGKVRLGDDTSARTIRSPAAAPPPKEDARQLPEQLSKDKLTAKDESGKPSPKEDQVIEQQVEELGELNANINKSKKEGSAQKGSYKDQRNKKKEAVSTGASA